MGQKNAVILRKGVGYGLGRINWTPAAHAHQNISLQRARKFASLSHITLGCMLTNSRECAHV